jgi:hypothetical protein
MNLVQALTKNALQTLLTLQTRFVKHVQKQYPKSKESMMLRSSVVQT